MKQDRPSMQFGCILVEFRRDLNIGYEFEY